MRQLAEEEQERLSAQSEIDEFDALIDKVYFIMGYCLLRGWNFPEGWRRVHAANMLKERAKEDGSNSKRDSGFDVVKPEGWEHPDLSDLITPWDSGGHDWDATIDNFKYLVSEVIRVGKVPVNYASMGAAMRFSIQPLLERISAGERSKGLLEEITDTSAEFSEVLK